MGNTSFYINAYGKQQAEEAIFSSAVVSQFTLPVSLYQEFKNGNSDFATAIITYRIYEGPTLSNVRQVGDPKNITLWVMAKDQDCSPSISVSIRDINADTIALTGDNSILIRYKSDALCEVNVTHKQIAPQVIYMNGITVNGYYAGGLKSNHGEATFRNVSERSFTVQASNSMGFRSTEIVVVATDFNPINTKAVVILPYSELTFVPSLSRPTSGENKVYAEFNGSMFIGSFGAQSNHLTISYRYREAGTSVWVYDENDEYFSIDHSNIYFSDGSTYRSVQPIELEGTYDYRKAYEIEFYVFDGSADASVKLTEITALSQVSAGVPIFDWGKNDFNINVALKINHVDIFDIIYPVGSVYMSTSNTLPPDLLITGEWTAMSNPAANIYAWERTG